MKAQEKLEKLLDKMSGVEMPNDSPGDLADTFRLAFDFNDDRSADSKKGMDTALKELKKAFAAERKCLDKYEALADEICAIGPEARKEYDAEVK